MKKESVDSRDVTTHGMSIELEVRNEGSGTKVSAALHVGSWETYVYGRLSDGEELILTDPSGDKRALAFTGTEKEAKYGADVSSGDGTYLVDFIRVKGAASALANKIVLPTAFKLTAPPTAARSQPLTFTWDAAPSSNGVKMRYSVQGDCVQPEVAKEIIGDPGSFTLNAGTLKAATGKEMASCNVRLTVVRASETEDCCSAEFGHKSIARGIQQRIVSFESVP